MINPVIPRSPKTIIATPQGPREAVEPLMVRSDLPASLKTKLKELFLEMERLPLGSETLQAFRQSRGFERFQAEKTEYQAEGVASGGVATGLASDSPVPATGSGT